MYYNTALPLLDSFSKRNQPYNTFSTASTLPLTQSLSHNYFQYAKDTMKYGNLSNIVSNSMPYHPFHASHQMSLDPDPYHQLYSREGMVYRKLNNNNVIPSYTLPKINHDNREEIRDGEIVYFPNDTLVPLSHVDHYISKRNKKQDSKEKSLGDTQSLNNINDSKHNIGEQFNQMHMYRRKNSRKWGFIRAVVAFIGLYKNMHKFTKISLDIKGKKFLHIQAAKEALIEIRTFLLPSLGNLETFCVQFFHSAIRYNTNDINKQKNSVFIIKSFIHQLFSDLTAAFARNDDIPGKIRKIFRMYISDGVVLPYGFLSTFEFNRLEFDMQARLVNMNKDRKGMMVCFILLYRVLLIDIFKRHYSFFPQIQAMEPNEAKIEEEMTRRVHQGERGKGATRKYEGSKSRSKSNRRYDDGDGDGDDYGDYEDNRDRGRERGRGSQRDVNANAKRSLSKGKTRRKQTKDHVSNFNDNDNDEYDDRNFNVDFEDNQPLQYNNDEEIDYEHNYNQNQRRPKNNKQSTKKAPTKKKKSTKPIKMKMPSPNPPQKRSKTVKQKNVQREPSRSKTKSKSKSKSKTMLPQSKSKSRSKTRRLPDINTHNPKQTRRNILAEDLGDSRYMKRRSELDEEEEYNRARERVKIRPNRLKEAIRKEKKKKLRDKITHNFNFLINVLHHIFFTTFLENVDIYQDPFKERHCYNLMVYKKDEAKYTQSDDIELIKGVVLNTKVTDNFIRQNERWIQMYKLSTYQFCCDFARKAMKE